MLEVDYKNLKELTESALEAAWVLRGRLYRCEVCASADGNDELAETFESMWYSLGWICLLYTSPSPRDS